MRVVIAPDSFKESINAAEAAEAIAEGVMRAAPDAQFDLVPMADGGEGTVAALVAATDGAEAEAMVTGPMGEPTVASYGLLGDGSTAVIEMAAAAGLHLIPKHNRDPRKTTTYGVGELIQHALDCGVSKIIVGIGGSATNDAGAGMAQALGVALRDNSGKDVQPGGLALANVREIDAARIDHRVAKCQLLVACDVDAPLCGPKGASLVYAPQKGADDKAAHQLDAALQSFGKLLEKQLGVQVMDLPGAGAAGGLGAGLVAFCGAKLVPGAKLVADTIGLEERIQGADLVITGEGMLDGQTATGKTPASIARIAKHHGVPVIALAGAIEPGFEPLYDEGLTAALSITHSAVPLEEALPRTKDNLSRTAEAAMRIFLAGAATG